MQIETIPTHLTVTIPTGYPGTGDKIEVIKAIRTISGYGLKEAKDLSEKPGEADLRVFCKSTVEFGNACETLTRRGVKTGYPVFGILEELRELAGQALKLGEDELANEILQLVLAEKLRRKS